MTAAPVQAAAVLRGMASTDAAPGQVFAAGPIAAYFVEQLMGHSVAVIELPTDSPSVESAALSRLEYLKELVVVAGAAMSVADAVIALNWEAMGCCGWTTQVGLKRKSQQG